MPKVLKTLQIADSKTSTVWDYRDEIKPNGGRIPLQACVHHIPVLPNVPGRSDLDKLRDVLLNQKLMVQFGTDSEGNVGMYTRANRLCYHAKGANSVSCGIEHMHKTVEEPWSKRQVNAAGWIVQLLLHAYGLPLRPARLENAGLGLVRVVRTGHTTHAEVARVAGTYGRSDPGAGWPLEKIFAAARYFQKHGHFVGA